MEEKNESFATRLFLFTSYLILSTHISFQNAGDFTAIVIAARAYNTSSDNHLE